MKMVTFAKVPGEFNAGEQRLLPDDMAEQLMKEKKITAMEPWPSRDEAAPAPRDEPARKPLLGDRMDNQASRKADRFAPRRAR